MNLSDKQCMDILNSCWGNKIESMQDKSITRISTLLLTRYNNNPAYLLSMIKYREYENSRGCISFLYKVVLACLDMKEPCNNDLILAIYFLFGKLSILKDFGLKDLKIFLIDSYNCMEGMQNKYKILYIKNAVVNMRNMFDCPEYFNLENVFSYEDAQVLYNTNKKMFSKFCINLLPTFCDKQSVVNILRVLAEQKDTELLEQMDGLCVLGYVDKYECLESLYDRYYLLLTTTAHRGYSDVYDYLVSYLGEGSEKASVNELEVYLVKHGYTKEEVYMATKGILGIFVDTLKQYKKQGRNLTVFEQVMYSRFLLLDAEYIDYKYKKDYTLEELLSNVDGIKSVEIDTTAFKGTKLQWGSADVSLYYVVSNYVEGKLFMQPSVDVGCLFDKGNTLCVPYEIFEKFISGEALEKLYYSGYFETYEGYKEGIMLRLLNNSNCLKFDSVESVKVFFRTFEDELLVNSRTRETVIRLLLSGCEEVKGNFNSIFGNDLYSFSDVFYDTFMVLYSD